MRPSLTALAAAASITTASAAMAIEEPAFRVVESSGRIELREYAPFVVAETVVDGPLSTASNRGFRAIAGYIFGGNRSVRGDAEKIAMTAPVVVEPLPGEGTPAAPRAPSERIAMTAPVTVEPQGATGPDALATGTRWRVHFVMPASYTLATLPRPDDPSVVLREVPAERRAVLRFSGLAGEAALREASAELLAWVEARGLVAHGPPQLARYDPPWTLPFLRRNEVTVGVRAERDAAR
jgi:hypothetical protein